VGHGPSNSLVYAVLAATFVVAEAIPVGHAVARGMRGGAALDALAVLAFLTPASVLGVGLIAAWNRPATQLLYASGAIVAVALSARYAAIGIRTSEAVFAQGSPSLEEAAAVGGAGFFRRLIRILVPVHARGLAAAWLLTGLFCLRDLEAAALLYPAGAEPLTVRIFTLEANGPPPVLAALACLQVVLSAGVLALGTAWLLRRRR
jgi:iron(III) transport system permease protein